MSARETRDPSGYDTLLINDRHACFPVWYQCISMPRVVHFRSPCTGFDELLAWAQSTGVEFPEVTTLWDGDKMRSVGAGVRAKKFGFLPVKVSTCCTVQSASLLCRCTRQRLLQRRALPLACQAQCGAPAEPTPLNWPLTCMAVYDMLTLDAPKFLCKCRCMQ